MIVFFFNDTATTEIYTLSLHDALPISAPTTGRRDRRAELSACLPPPLSRPSRSGVPDPPNSAGELRQNREDGHRVDRKSTRLNSSHANISYAVFCLKKKNNDNVYMSTC